MAQPIDVELTSIATHLMATYAWAIDARSYGDFAEVFAPDVRADYQSFSVAGVDDLMTAMERMHAGLRSSQHVIGSVQAGHDSDGVWARGHVRVTLVGGDAVPGRVEGASSYFDRLVAGGPFGWLVAERRVVSHWVDGQTAVLRSMLAPSTSTGRA